MTAVLEDLRSLTVDELGGLRDSGDDDTRAAVMAECERRDRSRAASTRARRWHRERSQPSGWIEAAHAQYTAAEGVTNGYMLSDWGKRHIHGAVFPKIWELPEREIGRYITEELDQFFRGSPRLTAREYWRQIEASDHDERETAAAETAATEGTETRDMGLIYGALRTAQMASQASAQRQRSQGMTDAECRQRTQATRERIKAQRAQRQLAAQAVQGMASQAQAQEARKAHQAVAVPAQAAPARRQREHIDGTAVLGYVRAWLAHYARLPESALDAATLWAAHACAKDNDGVMIWDASPRLMFMSSEPGSGKSRMLELVSLLCGSRYGLLAEPTAPAIAHILGSVHEPAFLDEGDVLFGAGKRKEALRALLNAGYTRAGMTLHMRGSKLVELPVFGAVALAGLDVLKTATNGTLGPLLDRSIIVRMRKSTDKVPQLNAKTRAEGAMLHAALVTWAQQEREALEQAEVELPDWLTGRAAEIWAPLFLLAGTAAASHAPASEHDDGGNWPERVMMAAEDLALAPELAGEETDDLMAGLAGMAEGWEG